MEYILENKNIIVDKNSFYNEYFLNLLCNSVFDLFTFEVNKPRILLNKSIFEKLNSKLKINCDIDFFASDDFTIFCFCTHEGEFDLGVFLSEVKDKVIIKFVSGSGHILSDVKFSVLEKNLKKYQKNTEKQIKNSDFLIKIQKFDIIHKK